MRMPSTGNYPFNNVLSGLVTCIVGFGLLLLYRESLPPLCEDASDEPCRERIFLDDLLSTDPIDPTRR